MGDMIERVSEALAQSFRDTVARVSGESWEETGVTLPSKEVFERYARAAIEAMRKPTAEMSNAAGDLLISYDNGHDTDEVWRTMIDTALSGPK